MKGLEKGVLHSVACLLLVVEKAFGNRLETATVQMGEFFKSGVVSRLERGDKVRVLGEAGVLCQNDIF